MQLLHTIYFGLGSDEVKDSEIDILMEVLAKNAVTHGAGVIMLQGSTCATPLFKPETKAKFFTNLGLSAMRTINVSNKLLAAGYPENRIINCTYHGVKPSPSGEVPDAASCRVVEIWFAPTMVKV